jgi:hypothetical protein
MAENKVPPEDDFLPEPCPLAPNELAAVYAKLKAKFSAADLQRFTEEDENIPMEQILSEAEAVHRRIVETKR